MSGLEASIAVYRGLEAPGTLLAESLLPPGHRQLESLIPTIAATLERLGVLPGNIAGGITSRGPGSFTGLRTVFASLKGIALANGAVLETIDSSEMLLLDYLASGGKPSSRYGVLSELSPKKLLLNTYVPTGSGTVVKQSIGLWTEAEPLGPDTLLLVPRTDTLAIVGPSARVHILRASALVRIRSKALSLQTYQTSEAISLAAPEYYASGFTTQKTTP